MNVQDYILIALIVSLAALALFFHFRRKAAGKGCCGNCSDCAHCAESHADHCVLDSDSSENEE